MIWKERRTGGKGNQSGEDDCQQQFAVNNTLAAPFKSLVHFCKCARRDLIAYVGWFCTKRLTFALRRQQGEADHTSVTTRDQTRFRAPPVNTDAMTNGFLGANEKSGRCHAADAIGAPLMVCSEWCNYDSDNACNHYLGLFPGLQAAIFL